MAILSRACKPDNIESHNSLNLFKLNELRLYYQEHVNQIILNHITL